MQITRWIQTAVAPGRWRGEGRTAAVSVTAGAGAPLNPGTLLDGRYEIATEIGRGRAGTVYSATDLKMNRPVAIRVFSAPRSVGKPTPLLDQRLRQEARAVAVIRHPNVVTLHDFGRDADLGVDFLVMELLEGGGLPALIRRHGTPNIPAVIRVLSQATAGVAAGHREGVVHRTLSPTSVFLEAADGSVRVRVLDFGLADLVRTEPESVAVAAPEYRSPEQLQGASWVSPASDVFSLGGIGHFMLTGAPVWGSGADRTIAGMEGARRRLLDDRRLPIGLREVLARSLASHPEDRYPDARALLIALDEIDRAEVVQPAAVQAEPRPDAQPAYPTQPATVDRGSGLPGRAVDVAGTGAVVAGAGAVCLLASFASYFSLLGAAFAIFAAIQLLGDTRGNEPVRRAMIGAAGLALLGLILARALQGSLPDLLFGQIVISAILPHFTAARRTMECVPERSSEASEVVSVVECPDPA